ncbi:MAG TPA: SusD/RagB family nutrient-binding outer membrane lipoprotein [Cyclobacteriaceae bacterium]|nr:SusD/RagB family nutrient-binding outer membrane lipoprotein [Cyclobacteriaceae bacterium]
MKKTKILTQGAMLIIATMLPFAGCDTSELHNLNVNPNALLKVNVNFLFTAAELSTACNGAGGDNWYTNWRTNIGTCAYAIQQLAAGAGGISQGDKYFENQEASQGVWDWYFEDQLKNLNEVLKQTGTGGFEEGHRKNTREAARILKVVNVHRLTDWFGNIPYSEADKGTEGALFPKYDKQQDIYTDMLKELHEACTSISASNEDDGFASSDMIYQGDIAKWKKWGYTLMLRLAMRMSNVNAAGAATYVTEAAAGGVFASNADNAIIPMSTPQLWNDQNGITRSFVDGSQPTTLSKTLVDKLMGPNAGSTADDDPRLMIISGGLNGDMNPLNQKGLPNGLDAGTVDVYTGHSGTDISKEFSGFNSKFLDRDEPYMMMNYAEAEFLLAEAKERNIGTVGGTADVHYANGVKAAMQMYTINDPSFVVSDAAVAVYLATFPYAGTTDQKQEMIGTQLWISKFLNWWEAWNDWRRSGHPTLTPINYPGNLTGGLIPRKLKLPTSEAALNTANREAGMTNPDTQVGKVWWDGGN